MASKLPKAIEYPIAKLESLVNKATESLEDSGEYTHLQGPNEKPLASNSMLSHLVCSRALESARKILATTVLAAGVMGLAYKIQWNTMNYLNNMPSQIVTNLYHASDYEHISSMEKFIAPRHGMIDEIITDVDFDGDLVNDPALKMGDGTVFHTSSKRLKSGEDHALKRTWYRTGEWAISHSKKGDYKVEYQHMLDTSKRDAQGRYITQSKPVFVKLDGRVE